MKLKTALSLLAFVALVQSCKKSGDVTPDDPTVTGNTDGNYLVKAVAITRNGADTNIVELKWDGINKLSQYKSSGRNNGMVSEAVYDIFRNTSGSIYKVKQIPFGAFNAFDSVVSKVTYVTGSTKLLRSVSISYSSFYNMNDSTVFTYNTAGKVAIKTVYADNLFSSAMSLSVKETYTYDASGNMIKSVANTYNAGVVAQTVTLTMTYDGHKSAGVLGDEGFLVPLYGSVSPNNMTKVVQSTTNGAQTIALTGTYSNFQFNSFDRPYKNNMNAVQTDPSGVTQTSAGVYTYFYK